MADIKTEPTAIAAILAGLSLDVATLVWGAIGGYVSMARTSSKVPRGTLIATLATSALVANALTALLAWALRDHLQGVALPALEKAVAFGLGFGFFKVADPIIDILLNGVRAFVGARMGQGAADKTAPANPQQNGDQAQGETPHG